MCTCSLGIFKIFSPWMKIPSTTFRSEMWNFLCKCLPADGVDGRVVIGVDFHLVPRPRPLLAPEDDFPIVGAGGKDGSVARMSPGNLFVLFDGIQGLFTRTMKTMSHNIARQNWKLSYPLSPVAGDKKRQIV
jgi:hypothetical protein